MQQALAQLAVNLRTVVPDVRSEIVNMRGAASEIAAGNQDLSSRTEAQASSLQQTAASMEQINGTVRQSAATAAQGGRLAQRTSEAAREIKQLIHESNECVAAGNAQSQDASLRMAEALQKVGGVGAIVSAATEQQAGMGQVNSAVSHLDSVTQQNAAMVEQMAAAAQSLNGQVDAVLDSMRLFRLSSADSTVAQVGAVALRKAAKVAVETY